jgi:UDP-N-acetylglucosamine acyltransferase
MANIHPTAIIHPQAKLADGVSVGPFSIIGENVAIGAGTRIGANCLIEGHTSIGRDNRIFKGAVIGTIPQDLKYRGEETNLIIGDANIIREYVTINLGTSAKGQTRIGNNNLIMAYAHIAHDCIVGDNVIIANCGTLAGHVEIQDKAIIGGLVAIHQFVRIGKFSIIGGCSKVVQDIPPFSACDGHPAKVYGLNTVGLKRAGFSGEVLLSLKRAFKILFKSGLSLTHALEEINRQVPDSEQLRELVGFMKNSKRGIAR